VDRGIRFQPAPDPALSAGLENPAGTVMAGNPASEVSNAIALRLVDLAHHHWQALLVWIELRDHVVFRDQVRQRNPQVIHLGVNR
jgi:hypothetical protein